MKQSIRRIAALIVGLGLGVAAIAGLETVTTIQDLNAAWPLGSDLASTSDDHIRNIKTALKNTFPATVQGDLLYSGSTANEFSVLHKSTTATQYLANTGSSNNPTWDQIDLSSGVKNTLSLANLNKTTAGSWTATQTFLATPFAVTVQGNNASYELLNDSAVEILRLSTVLGWVGSGSTTNGAISSRADMFLYADNSSNPTVHFTSTAVEGRGPTAAGLVDMTPDTGTFTGTFTGMTGTVTSTETWTRIGKLVTLNIAGATGTSNANTFTMTGLPAAIQPASVTTRINLDPYGVTDNGSTLGTISIGEVSIPSSSGTLTFLKSGLTTGWTSSGTKGISAGTSITFSYLLN